MAVALAIFAALQVAVPLWVRPNLAPAACTAPSIEGNPPVFAACLASQGIREAIAYQPASRYWPFQWTETAIYLALALALAGYCFDTTAQPPPRLTKPAQRSRWPVITCIGGYGAR